jgi:hypothetical protein
MLESSVLDAQERAGDAERDGDQEPQGDESKDRPCSDQKRILKVKKVCLMRGEKEEKDAPNGTAPEAPFPTRSRLRRKITIKTILKRIEQIFCQPSELESHGQAPEILGEYERRKDRSNRKAKLLEVLPVQTSVHARRDVASDRAEEGPGDDEDRSERSSVRGREEAEQGED